MNVTNSINEIQNLVEHLDYQAKSMFVYKIVENLFHYYNHFHKIENWGNIEIWAAGIEFLKKNAFNIPFDVEKLRNITKELLESDDIAPDSEVFGSLESSLALDACSGLFAGLQFAATKNPAKINELIEIFLRAAEMSVAVTQNFNAQMSVANREKLIFESNFFQQKFSFLKEMCKQINAECFFDTN